MKTWAQSKTIVFGILSIIIAVANYYGFADFDPTSNGNELLEFLYGVFIIIFRAITKTGIEKRLL